MLFVKYTLLSTLNDTIAHDYGVQGKQPYATGVKSYCVSSLYGKINPHSYKMKR